MKTVSLTPGMAQVLFGKSHRVDCVCESCQLPVPVQGDHYPAACPSCRTPLVRLQVPESQSADFYSVLYEDFMHQVVPITTVHSWSVDSVQRDLLRQSAYPFLFELMSSGDMVTLYESLWFINFSPQRCDSKVFGLLEAAHCQLKNNNSDRAYWTMLGAKSIGIYAPTLLEDVAGIARRSQELVSAAPGWLRQNYSQCNISEDRQMQLLSEAYLSVRDYLPHTESIEYAVATLLCEAAWSLGVLPSSVLNPRQRRDRRIVVGGFRFNLNKLNAARTVNKGVQNRILSRKNRSGGLASRMKNFRTAKQNQQSRDALVKAIHFQRHGAQAGRMHRALGQLHRSAGTFRNNESAHASLRHVRDEQALRLFENGQAYYTGKVLLFTLDEVGVKCTATALVEKVAVGLQGAVYVRGENGVIHETVISVFDGLLTESQIEQVVCETLRQTGMILNPSVRVRVYNDVPDFALLTEELSVAQTLSGKYHQVTSNAILLEKSNPAREARKAVVQQKYQQLRQALNDKYREQMSQISASSQDVIRDKKEQLRAAKTAELQRLLQDKQRELKGLNEEQWPLDKMGDLVMVPIRGAGKKIEQALDMLRDWIVLGVKRGWDSFKKINYGGSIVIGVVKFVAWLLQWVFKIGTSYSYIYVWWGKKKYAFLSLTEEEENQVLSVLTDDKNLAWIDKDAQVEDVRKEVVYIAETLRTLWDRYNEDKDIHTIEKRTQIVASDSPYVKNLLNFEFDNVKSLEWFKWALLNYRGKGKLAKEQVILGRFAQGLTLLFGSDGSKIAALPSHLQSHFLTLYKDQSGKYGDFVDFIVNVNDRENLSDVARGVLVSILKTSYLWVNGVLAVGPLFLLLAFAARWTIGKPLSGLKAIAIWGYNKVKSKQDTIIVDNQSESAWPGLWSMMKSASGGLLDFMKSTFGSLFRYVTTKSLLMGFENPQLLLQKLIDKPMVVGKSPLICMKSRYRGSVLVAGDSFTIKALESKESLTAVLADSEGVVPDNVVVLEGSVFTGKRYAFVNQVVVAVAYSPTFLKMSADEAAAQKATEQQMRDFISSQIGKVYTVKQVPLFVKRGKDFYQLPSGAAVKILSFLGDMVYEGESLPTWSVGVGDSLQAIQATDGGLVVSTTEENLYYSMKNLSESVAGLDRVMSLYEEVAR